MVPVDDVDLLDRLADRLIAGDGAIDVDRPELFSDPAFVEARHVGHQRFGFSGRAAAGEAIDLEAVIFGQLLGQIIVAVDQRGGLEDAVDALAVAGSIS